MSEVEINETLPRVASETLLHFEQEDFLIWDIDWHSIHPFRADTSAEEHRWLNEWMVQAFDELIEMEQIGMVIQRFTHAAEPSFIQLELTGKYHYLSLEELEARFRHLKALVRFIAEYSNNLTWLKKLEEFENGELEHS